MKSEKLILARPTKVLAVLIFCLGFLAWNQSSAQFVNLGKRLDISGDDWSSASHPILDSRLNRIQWEGHILEMGSKDYAHNTLRIVPSRHSDGQVHSNFSLYRTPSTGNPVRMVHFTSEGKTSFIKSHLSLEDKELRKVRAIQFKDWDDNSGGTDYKYRILARDGAMQFYNGGVVVGSYVNGTWGDLADGNLIVEHKVGIGTKDPDAAGSNNKLVVQGDANIGGTGNAKLRVRHVDGKAASSGSLDHLYLNYNNGKNVYVGTGGTRADLVVGRNIVAKDGTMCVGTDNPGDATLAVGGSIRSEEVVVELFDDDDDDGGWPDYVFKPGYDLPTLAEVEKHIAEKGHLKDIPSAEEVVENGVKLGEMQSKLLQKIEELTLYILDQQKQIDTLKSKIDEK